MELELYAYLRSNIFKWKKQNKGVECLTSIKAHFSSFFICALEQVFWLSQLWFSDRQWASVSTEPALIP